MSNKWKCTEIKGPIDLTKLDITFFTGGLALPKFKDGSEITTDDILQLMIDKIKEKE